MRRASSLKNLRKRVEGLQVVRRGKRIVIIAKKPKIKPKYKAKQ